MTSPREEQQVRESIQHMAEKAAESAVVKVLGQLGVDTSDPIKAQEQFAALRRLAVLIDDKGFVEDIAWLRRVRTASDIAKDVGWRTIVKLIVTATIGIVAVGTKDWWISFISSPK